MSRLLPTSLVLAALGFVPGCKKGSSVDPIDLVPDQAGMVGGVDVKALMGSSVYQKNKSAIEDDERAKAFIAGARECNLDPAGFKGVTFGVDSASRNGIAIFEGKGVGKKDNLTCVHGKIKEAEGKDPWTFAEHDGKPVLEMGDQSTIGYMVNDNVLALVTTGWETALRELIEGKGTPARKGSLKELYGRADKDKPLWFAGVAPKDILKNLGEGPAQSITDFSGSLDVESGLGLRLVAGAETAEAATSLKDEAQKQFDAVKPLAPMVGVPKTIMDSVSFSVDGSTMVAQASVSTQALEDLRNRLEGKAPAGADAAPPAGVMPEQAEGADGAEPGEAPAPEPAAEPAQEAPEQ